jgi:hypothetical protein
LACTDIIKGESDVNDICLISYIVFDVVDFGKDASRSLEIIINDCLHVNRKYSLIQRLRNAVLEGLIDHSVHLIQNDVQVRCYLEE